MEQLMMSKWTNIKGTWFWRKFHRLQTDSNKEVKDMLIIALLKLQYWSWDYNVQDFIWRDMHYYKDYEEIQSKNGDISGTFFNK
jgi:hypothetical protein